MLLFVVAFVGGAASALTPCVLPMLPALLTVSGSGRRRAWGIVVGLELSFFLLGIVLAGLLSATGLSDQLLQWVAAGLIAFFGMALLVPALDRRLQSRISALVAGIQPGPQTDQGFWSGVTAGAPLGLVWAPCAGPILAGVTAAAASTRFSGRTVLMMIAYALGMLGPLVLIVVGGQRLGLALKRKLRGGRRVPAVMGVVLLATSLLIATGALNSVNRFIAERINLTSTPTAQLEKSVLIGAPLTAPDDDDVELSPEDLAAAGYPEFDDLVDYGPAPEFEGISRWFNTDDELSIAGLRGKVVLIDFWTYSCINCIRTFPHLRAWYEDYHDDGFEIVGVHSPEFAFEKDEGNVLQAIGDFDIEYPVGMDNDFETWDNYYNLYWPAHYLIDRAGHIRSVHYGEGAYERTENEIRELLALAPVEVEEEELSFLSGTPETYLGYGRADRFAGQVDGSYGMERDVTASYESPPVEELPEDWWSYEGNWTIHEDFAVSGEDAVLKLHYRAADVFMVAGPGDDAPGRIRVTNSNGSIEAIVIDSHQLYTLGRGDHSEGFLEIEVDPGIEVYTFTFG